jgi:4-hydroxy-tetrahydrodipicolinate synthase
MARVIFTGVYVPLVTPVGVDGELNAPVLQQLVEWVIAQGASGVVPCGTTGESPTLSHEEHQRVIALTVEYAAGRVPVIAGTGSNSTSEAVDLTIAADELGVDGMLVTVPYYNRPSQQGLLAHYTAVAAATDKPIIMYNIPKRTGVNMEAATICELARVDNITGIKEASGDIAQIMAIIQGTAEFSVLTGDDNLLFSLCALGGHGGICSSSHFLPGEWVRMVELLQGDKLAEARRLHYFLLPLAQALFGEPNPAPLKAALQMVGMPVGDPRLPLMPATDKCRATVRKALESVRLLKAAQA